MTTARSGGDPDGSQAGCDLVAISVELAIGQMGVSDAARPVASRGHDGGQGVRLPPGHRAEVVAISSARYVWRRNSTDRLPDQGVGFEERPYQAGE